MTVTAIFSLCGYRTRELDLMPALGLALIALVVVMVGMHS
jgi:uncharacterized membrane protein YfbV (UPF0208 family)